jgi:hypothetical protein
MNFEYRAAAPGADMGRRETHSVSAKTYRVRRFTACRPSGSRDRNCATARWVFKQQRPDIRERRGVRNRYAGC